MTINAQDRRPPGPHTPFVGRGPELAQLGASSREVLHGGGHIFLVSGDPGIGKTRLANEVADRAAAVGFTVSWGRCWEAGGAPAFWPWVQALRGYGRATGTTAEPPPHAPHADDNLPALATLVGVTSHAGRRTLDPDQMRFRLFDAAVTFFRAAAVERPLLLILDDLHAADIDSLLLLRFLGRELRDIRLLVIGTYRDAEARIRPAVAALLGDVAREATSIQLHGWSETEVNEFIGAGAGGGAPFQPSTRADLVHMVSRVTEGNPFFVEEIVRLWTGRGDYRAIAEPEALCTAIPDTVRAAVRQRLALLSTGSRDVLGVAAVIGREFDAAVLHHVVGAQPAAPVGDLLDNAVAANLLTEVPLIPGRYSFSHILIRDTLYHDQSASRRAAVHDAVARAIETVRAAGLDAHLADLAHHFALASGDEAQALAVRYSLQAAERATANCAYADAVARCEDALGASMRLPSSDAAAAMVRRCELLLRLGDAHNMAGGRTDARDTFHQAAQLARELQLPEALARAALGYGGLWGGPEELLKFSKPEQGHFDDTLARLLREARDALGSRNPALRARLLSRLAVEVYFTDTPAQRDVLTQEALTLARRADDPLTLAVVLWDSHAAVWGPDSVRVRRAMAEEIVELAERIGDYGLELGGRAWLIGDVLEQGDGERAAAEFERYSRLAEAYRQPIHLWGLKNCRAQQALLGGDFDTVAGLASAALTLGLTLFAGAFIAYGQQMSALYHARGQHDELRLTETGLRGFIDRYPDLPHPRVALAHSLVVTGSLDEARAEFERLATHDFEDLPRDLGWSSAMVELAEVCAALGDSRRAATLYRALLPCAAYVAVSPFHAVCWGAVARSLGLLATLLQNWTGAEAHFAVALECNQRLKARPWIARTQYDYAAMLDARNCPGDHQKARHLLDEVSATANVLGMRPLAEHSAELIGRLVTAASPTPAPGPQNSDTTPRNRFARDGDLWSLTYAGKSCSLKDARGMGFIAELLRRPRRELHALELVHGTASIAGNRDSLPARGDLSQQHGDSDAGEILDAGSKAAYERRLAELRSELAEAQSFNDPGRSERAQHEIDILTRELGRAFGLGGRARRAGSTAERAHVNVTRALERALKNIRLRHPDLGHHLAETIKAGTFCEYKPDPRVPIEWDVAF